MNTLKQLPRHSIPGILLTLGIFSTSVKSQDNPYKEYQVCIETQIHKGKVDHGKSYCTAHATVREYKNGKKDTVSWELSSSQMFIGDEYKKYSQLSERGKYIVDSLKEDGIIQLQDSYLTYEPIYMKPGKKTEQLWAIEGKDVAIYEYLFHHDSNSRGIQLLRNFIIK